MQVIFQSRDPEGAQLRTLAIRRVRSALRRLGWLVPRATVNLSDVNGPRGGVDKRCRVELTTGGTGTIVITSVARDWRSALHSALSRAGQAVLHNFQRSRKLQRSRQSALAQDS